MEQNSKGESASVSILPILQVGEPILRQPARALTREEILGQPIQDLIVRMRETLRVNGGVGLAAPQVGEPVQVFVLEDRLRVSVPADREKTLVPFQVVVNPQVTQLGTEQRSLFEGCMSIGNATFRMFVERSRHVFLTCLNERAEPVTIEANGYHALILQHEIDHLAGILCLDKMVPRSFMTFEHYKRDWQNASLEDIRREFCS